MATEEQLQDLAEVLGTIGEIWSQPQTMKTKARIEPAELHARLVSTSTAFIKSPDSKSAKSFLAEIDAAVGSAGSEPDPVPASGTPTVTVTVTVTITITVKSKDSSGGGGQQE